MMCCLGRPEHRTTINDIDTVLGNCVVVRTAVTAQQLLTELALYVMV